MTWPFDKQPDANPAEVGPDGKPKAAEKQPEKSPAELIAEALRPLVEGNTKLQERLAAIEEATKKPEPKVEANQPMSVLDDENVAFAQRLTPLMLRQLELEARIVRNDIKAEYASAGYADLWAQYETDINKILEGTSVISADGKPLRGDPQYVRNVVDMTFGREARKAGMRFDGKAKGFFLETGGGGDGLTRQPENDGLTEGQRKVFGRMKVSLDDAKKVMGKLKFVQ